jgi:hypothetical protein
MSTLRPERQCCQGAKILAKNTKRANKYFEGLGQSGTEFLTGLSKKGQKPFGALVFHKII